ncbi:hypothetical protein CPB84DRAFT_1771049, partial [Gymnopilus junonius]
MKLYSLVLQALILRIASTTLVLASPSPAEDAKGIIADSEDCHWKGTAPFCEGSCEEGYTTERRDIFGDGHRCITGFKVYCC